jgi:hypothetical protein
VVEYTPAGLTVSRGVASSPQIYRELLKGLTLLLKLILDKNSTMVDQYYPKFGRKNVKICDNL